MHFDLEAVKKHPAIIAVILFGAFILYRLLQGNSSPVQATSGTNSQLAAIQAASAVQQSGQAASVQVSSDTLNAALADTAAKLELGKYQTDASVTESKYSTDAGVTVAGMQTQLAKSQIDASNYQADLAAAVTLAQTKAAADIESAYLSDAYGIALQRESDYQANVAQIIPHAGDKKNSALDATDQTALFQTILASGNPSVAASGNGATAVADTSGNGASVAKTTAITSAVTSVATSLVKGLF